jgi:hypothetical protein
MACLRKKLVIAYRADVRALEGAVIWKAACAGWEDWERLAAAAGEEVKLREMTGVRNPSYICVPPNKVGPRPGPAQDSSR